MAKKITKVQMMLEETKCNSMSNSKGGIYNESLKSASPTWNKFWVRDNVRQEYCSHQSISLITYTNNHMNFYTWHLT